MANSKAARAMPVAIDATPGRVRSRVIIASLKPWFSSPSRLPAGTSVSLKEIVAVFDARSPILSSCLSTVTVSSLGTTKGGDAAMAGVLVGLGVDRVPVGVAAVGDEALRAVDDVLVALPDRGRAHARDVRAGVRLGQAEGGELRLLDQASRGTPLLISSEPPSNTGAAASSLAPSVVAIAAQPQASSSPIKQPSR